VTFKALMIKQTHFGVAKVMFSNGSVNILFLSYRFYGVMSINSRETYFYHTVAEKENVIPQFSR